MSKPVDLKPGAPLVMVWHGYTEDADMIKNYSKFDDLVNRNGFVAVYPQGNKNADGDRNWNVGYEWQKDSTVNDVNFARTLVS